MPSRVSNQAVVIVARDAEGNVCPVPVAALKIYKECEPASYDQLRDQMVEAIKENFSTDIFSRLSGVTADGPYQTKNFRSFLVKYDNINFDDTLSLPVTWYPAHLLNLAATDV